MAEGRDRKPRRAWTVLARLALGLLLLCQIGVLWVLSHASPTRLPASFIGALAEAFAGRLDFECREATVDRRGRIRLAGARLSDSLHPGDALTGDVELVPDWRGIALGQPRILSLLVRGRGNLGSGTDGAALDEFVIRTDGARRVRVAARTGAMTLLVTAEDAVGMPAAQGPDDGVVGWDRDAAIAILRTLRAMDGAVALHAGRGAARLVGGFRENPTVAGPLALRAASGRFSGEWGTEPRLELELREVRGQGFAIEHAWLGAGRDLRLRGILAGIRHDGLSGVSARVDGRLRTDGESSLQVRADTGASRLEGVLELAPGVIRLREVAARVDAADLTRLAPLAQAARSAGLDLSGPVELLGGEATWSGGELLSMRTDFSIAQVGWHDIRPSIVRPEGTRPHFSGDLALDLRANRIELTQLDLAGLAGEITGGLHAGDPFVVRLASTQGNPVNPGCLNSLLGAWWVDLWSRFDLSTRATRPRADVRVTGRWGDAGSIRTAVRAQLDNFGFMGARFLRTDVRVDTHGEETLVRIDELRGELDGADAGSARGTARWDWSRKEWQGMPQIEAEGDLLPACALRLYDPAVAARLQGWAFGEPRLRVSLGPDHPLRVSLEAPKTSTLGGVRVEGLKLTVTRPRTNEGDLRIEGSGLLSGGRASLAITGDLAARNQLDLKVSDWNRSGAEALIEQLGGPAASKTKTDPSSLSLTYAGTCDFGAPQNSQGQGTLRLVDPRLKTVHLLGILSSTLDALGIGFSSYPLTQADLTFSCAEGQMHISPLRISGEDAMLNLFGKMDLSTGKLGLSGRFTLKDSPWGPLKYINPNRLISNIINVDIRGTVNKPEVRANIGDSKINK